MTRLHNFNAGPATLPVSVLEEAQRNLVDHQGLGLSVLEMSHRSGPFQAIVDRAMGTLRRLLSLPDDYEILFLQGGASLQFAMAPLNLPSKGAYVNTGVWSQKAIDEARKVGRCPHEAWTDAAGGYRRVPGPDEDLDIPAGTPWLHLTSNNTVVGTQWHHLPAGETALVCDMSSDFLSRPIDVSRYGLLYAGAQKNAGPSGVTVVIGRRAWLRGFHGPDTTPTLLRYDVLAKAESLYNTPSTFGIWICSLVFDWIEAQGGLQAIASRNEQKARLLYDVIDRRPDLFRGHASPESRSLMNVTFNLPTPELERRFREDAEKAGCIGLEGHRLVGGLRASIYNAMPLASVEVLAELMDRWTA